MRIPQTFLALAATTLLLAACGNKEPATNAVTQAEAAVTPLRDDASKYAPDQLKAVEATLAKMKDGLAKEDYSAVVRDVPQFNSEFKALQESVVQQQTLVVAAQHEWDTLNAEIPKEVEAIQVRVDALASTKLPKEVSKENFEAAKADFEALKATWAEATAAAQAGNTLEAADKARTVQAKAEEIKSELGMSPALAQSQATMTPPAGQDVAAAN